MEQATRDTHNELSPQELHHALTTITLHLVITTNLRTNTDLPDPDGSDIGSVYLITLI
jgi:hypothetical protein